MALVDGEPVRPKRVHEIGQDLRPLSVADIGERILVLRAEIERLQTELAAKSATKAAAAPCSAVPDRVCVAATRVTAFESG